MNSARRPSHRGSVGRASFGEIRVVGQDGVELAPGEIGEIVMRCAAGVPAPYRIVGDEQEQRSDWIALGDLGWMDEGGYLFIADRRDDVVLVAGENLYPAEIEAAV